MNWQPFMNNVYRSGFSVVCLLLNQYKAMIYRHILYVFTFFPEDELDLKSNDNTFQSFLMMN